MFPIRYPSSDKGHTVRVTREECYRVQKYDDKNTRKYCGGGLYSVHRMSQLKKTMVYEAKSRSGSIIPLYTVLDIEFKEDIYSYGVM